MEILKGQLGEDMIRFVTPIGKKLKLYVMMLPT